MGCSNEPAFPGSSKFTRNKIFLPQPLLWRIFIKCNHFIFSIKICLSKINTAVKSFKMESLARLLGDQSPPSFPLPSATQIDLGYNVTRVCWCLFTLRHCAIPRINHRFSYIQIFVYKGIMRELDCFLVLQVCEGY